MTKLNFWNDSMIAFFLQKTNVALSISKNKYCKMLTKGWQGCMFRMLPGVLGVSCWAELEIIGSLGFINLKNTEIKLTLLREIIYSIQITTSVSYKVAKVIETCWGVNKCPLCSCFLVFFDLSDTSWLILYFTNPLWVKYFSLLPLNCFFEDYYTTIKNFSTILVFKPHWHQCQ